MARIMRSEVKKSEPAGRDDASSAVVGAAESGYVSYGEPIIFITLVHVACAGPYGDLRTRPNSGVLLHEGCPNHIQFCAEQICANFGATRHNRFLYRAALGRLHATRSVQLALQVVGVLRKNRDSSGGRSLEVPPPF